jgi:hypothetical protein
VQCSCKTKLRADGQAEVHVSSGEESEAVTKEEDESEDEFVADRTKRASVEVGGAGREQRTRWKQLCKQLRLEVGMYIVWVSIGWWH